MDELTRTVQDKLLTPLHPHLKPIIAALPPQAHDFLISLLGQKCHSSLVLNLDLITDPDCLVLAISKALGLGIVSLSAIVKVPQILKLLRSHSASGVSFVSYALETTSLLITLAYNARQNLPFSTYGESAFIAVQDIVIAVLVLAFSGKKTSASAFVAAVAAVVYALIFSGEQVVDSEKMGYLQAGAGVLGSASKIPQIFTVWKEGGTGQLSAFAVFNYLAGSLARVFTTVQEVDDKLILYGFLAGFTLNAILAFQMIYYWGSSGKATASGRKEAKGKKSAKGKTQAAPVQQAQTPIGKGKSTGTEGKTTRTRRRG
ncbi:hypothetical protein KEM55_004363 [Ascosphaera atra]|nr:hypothetical protein KEM55_004363 [Ascosphaera atra]